MNVAAYRVEVQPATQPVTLEKINLLTKNQLASGPNLVTHGFSETAEAPLVVDVLGGDIFAAGVSCRAPGDHGG